MCCKVWKKWWMDLVIECPTYRSWHSAEFMSKLRGRKCNLAGKVQRRKSCFSIMSYQTHCGVSFPPVWHRLSSIIENLLVVTNKTIKLLSFHFFFHGKFTNLITKPINSFCSHPLRFKILKRLIKEIAMLVWRKRHVFLIWLLEKSLKTTSD